LLAVPSNVCRAAEFVVPDSILSRIRTPLILGIVFPYYTKALTTQFPVGIVIEDVSEVLDTTTVT
jgi:hypothetical protein